MTDRKLIATASLAGTYGPDTVRLERLTHSGPHQGRYVTRGGGFAGRVAYGTLDRARRVVQSHRCFIRWED